jgi:hypothetical protein
MRESDCMTATLSPLKDAVAMGRLSRLGPKATKAQCEGRPTRAARKSLTYNNNNNNNVLTTTTNTTCGGGSAGRGAIGGAAGDAAAGGDAATEGEAESIGDADVTAADPAPGGAAGSSDAVCMYVWRGLCCLCGGGRLGAGRVNGAWPSWAARAARRGEQQQATS